MTRLPYHRLPADAHPPLRLVVDHHVLAPDQSRAETLEIAVYLEVYLQLVDPEDANDRQTQVFQSRGQFN